jgi:hypothetical protein
VIRDAKGGLFAKVIDWYVGRKVRGAFRGVWVRGTLPSAEGGLLAYANHSSFWDGFIIQQLARTVGWDGYALMEEANLRKYPFHTRIGGISISREHPLESMRYTKQVLSRPNAALFIFPEGELRGGQGPLGPLRRGIELIAKTSKARCLPVGIRYAFLEHEHPDVLIEVGAAHGPEELEGFTSRLSAVYDQVRAVRSTEGFTRVITGRSSVQERWDRARRLPAPAMQHREDAVARRGDR